MTHTQLEIALSYAMTEIAELKKTKLGMDGLKTILTVIDNQDKRIDCFEKRLNDMAIFYRDKRFEMDAKIMQIEINAQQISIQGVSTLKQNMLEEKEKLKRISLRVVELKKVIACMKKAIRNYVEEKIEYDFA